MSEITDITGLSMINDLQRLQIISNNLANVGTVGFKRDIPVGNSFANHLQALQSNQVDNTAAASSSTPYGHIQSVQDNRAGALKYTGEALDLAIEGDGYFLVKKDGHQYMTRQGSLSLDAQGELVTAQGYVVEGVGGDIRLANSQPRIDGQGRIWEKDELVGQIKLVTVSDTAELTRMGEGLYKSKTEIPAAIVDEKVNIRQGALEASNVVTMQEMVNMIDIMRHFETSQKLIKSYDEILDTAIRTIGDI